jgi:hypothetical protein
MTSSEPLKRSPAGPNPKDADDASLCDALAIEHSTIYG